MKRSALPLVCCQQPLDRDVERRVVRHRCLEEGRRRALALVLAPFVLPLMTNVR